MDTAPSLDPTRTTARTLGEPDATWRPELARSGARRSRRPGLRAALRLVVAATIGLLASTVATPPASAHGADGDMTVLQAEQSGPLTISVKVGLVYSNDQEFAEDASVEVSATLDGTVAGPAELALDTTAGSELYVGELTVPHAGLWNVEIVSTGPAATATATVTVEETDDDSTPSTAPSTSVTSTTAADTTSTSAAPVTEDDAQSDEESSTPWLIVAGITVALVAGVVGWLAGSRGKSSGDADGGTADADGDPPSANA